MIYAYDIILNFHKKYYNFYEWNNKDIILNYKKIPIIKVLDKDFLKLKYHEVKINKEIINDLKNKSTLYTTNKNNNVVFLVTNLKETMGVMFDQEGYLLKKSSLLFEESEEVEELVAKSDVTKLTVEIVKTNDIKKISRAKEHKKYYISKYLKTIDNVDIFKYLYFDLYNKDADTNKNILNILINEDNNNLVNKLYSTIVLLNKQKN